MKISKMLVAVLTGTMAVTPFTHAYLGINNGDFNTGITVGDQADIDDWYSITTGSFWTSAWHTATADAPSGTPCVNLSGIGSTTNMVVGSSWMYQGIGTADGFTDLTIQFEWGRFIGAAANDLGITVSLYEDTTGSFVAGNNTDVEGAGLSLIDRQSFVNTNVIGGTVFTNTANFDLTSVGTANQVYLRINNFNPTTQNNDDWTYLDNIILIAGAPFKSIAVAPTGEGITNPVTLQATIVDLDSEFSGADFYLNDQLITSGLITSSPGPGTNVVSYTVPTNLAAQVTYTGKVVVAGTGPSASVEREWIFKTGGDPGYGVYIHDSTEPTPDADDIYQFTAGALPTNNVENGYANATYIRTPGAVQGQTFTTGSGSPNYELTAVWLKHVEYTTYNEFGVGFTDHLRITDPSQSGSSNFVIALQDLIVQTNAGVSMEGAVVVPNGSGNWIEYRLQTPLILEGNREYGFDVAPGPLSEELEVYELAGTTNAAEYTGGTAYSSGVDGVDDLGDPSGDNILTARSGDRTFMIKLAAVGPSVTPDIQSISLSSGSVTLIWQSEAGANYGVQRKSSLTETSWIEVINVPGSAGTTMATVPAGSDEEFFRIEGN